MNSVKFGLTTLALAAALHVDTAEAAVAQHYTYSNSVNYCQAFTPGPANTVRNRVVGAENVGEAPIAVACNFASSWNGAAGNTAPTRVSMYFANNNPSEAVIVTCTMLTGYQTSIGYTVTKATTSIPAGGTSQRNLSWNAADNPSPGATTLGSSLIGVNCTLPQGAVINDIFFYWNADNGV
jgi:hypothetical protein